MRTILVVDDELGTAEAIALLLEDEGFRVVRAYNGREGLTRAHELKPDLLIVDLMMPIMTGAQLIDEMRADPQLHDVPVILCSSLSEDTARQHARDFDAFLQKPTEVGGVLDLVHRLLDGGGGRHAR